MKNIHTWLSQLNYFPLNAYRKLFEIKFESIFINKIKGQNKLKK